MTAVQAMESVQPGDVKLAPDATPAESSAADKVVPYSRFHSVVEERNAARAEAQRLQDALISASKAPQAPVAAPATPTHPQTVEELVSMVVSHVDSKLAEKLTPLEQRSAAMALQSNVEKYFTQKPEAAALRQQMDDYTASLPPSLKNALVTSIINGEKHALDHIFYTVAGQQNAEISRMATEEAQAEAQRTAMPTAFRQVKSVEPTLAQSKADALKTRNFMGFFQKFAEQHT